MSSVNPTSDRFINLESTNKPTNASTFIGNVERLKGDRTIYSRFENDGEGAVRSVDLDLVVITSQWSNTRKESTLKDYFQDMNKLLTSSIKSNFDDGIRKKIQSAAQALKPEITLMMGQYGGGYIERLFKSIFGKDKEFKATLRAYNELRSSIKKVEPGLYEQISKFFHDFSKFFHDSFSKKSSSIKNRQKEIEDPSVEEASGTPIETDLTAEETQIYLDQLNKQH
jgi:hypothetical protein